MAYDSTYYKKQITYYKKERAFITTILKSITDYLLRSGKEPNWKALCQTMKNFYRIDLTYDLVSLTQFFLTMYPDMTFTYEQSSNGYTATFRDSSSDIIEKLDAAVTNEKQAIFYLVVLFLRHYIKTKMQAAKASLAEVLKTERAATSSDS